MAGFPATTNSSGTSFVTTEPAPTADPSPITTPGNIVQLAPILAPFLTIVGGSLLHLPLEGGYLSFVNTV